MIIRGPNLNLRPSIYLNLAASYSLGSGQAYCVFLFITGASVFGLLISHFNETWEAESRANREMEDLMEPYLAVRPK